MVDACGCHHRQNQSTGDHEYRKCGPKPVIAHWFNKNPVTTKKHNSADQHRIPNGTCGGRSNVDAVLNGGKAAEKSPQDNPIPIFEGFADHILLVGECCQNPFPEQKINQGKDQRDSSSPEQEITNASFQ